MTEENQKIRDSLKAAENIIVSALAHQPDNDDACHKHLLQAKIDVEKVINPDTKESVDFMRRSIADGERLLTKYVVQGKENTK